MRDPRNYFAGTPRFRLGLPENVLLFHRSEARMLGPIPACHHRFVLIVNCRTDGRVIVDARSFRLAEGYAILVFPHQFHHYLSIQAPRVNWLFITFEQRRAQHLLGLRNLPVAPGPRAWKILSDLVTTYRLPEKADRATADRTVLLAAELLNELVGATSRAGNETALPPPASPRQQRIDDINGFVAANLSRPLSIARVAENFALSESHIRVLYRRATGISLGAYMTSLRLNRASGLLLNSEMNVSQVATECGYESLFSFSRAFKRAMGVSPRAYRRQRQG
jgi:AraC-like DNA-binding protein